MFKLTRLEKHFQAAKRKCRSEAGLSVLLHDVVLIAFRWEVGVARAACVLYPWVQDQKNKGSRLPSCTRHWWPRITLSPWQPAYHPWSPSISNPVCEPTGQHQKGTEMKRVCVWGGGNSVYFWHFGFSSHFVFCFKSTQQPDPSITQTDTDSHTFNLPTPPLRASGFKRTWEYDVPDISMEDKPMPEMPSLESALGNCLQTVRRAVRCLPLTTRDTDTFMVKWTVGVL